MKYQDNTEPAAKERAPDDSELYYATLGKDFIRLYRAALALGVPTVIETPDATVTVKPKDKVAASGKWDG